MITRDRQWLEVMTSDYKLLYGILSYKKWLEVITRDYKLL